MSERFSIPVMYKDNELSFEAVLQKSGYIIRIAVIVDGVTVIFEPDEEKNYRAFIEAPNESLKIDIELLKAIADVLKEASV